MLESFEEKQTNLESMLSDFVDKQIRLSDLVVKRHNCLLENPEQAKKYNQEAALLEKEINKFAREILQNPKIIKEIEQRAQESRKEHNIVSLGNCGGYKGIKERLKSKQITNENIEVLYMQILSKSKSLHLSRNQNRDEEISR